MTDIQNIFKALSDETRLRCICLLYLFDELCVCQLHEALDISQPKMSRHLAILKDYELVDIRKEGTWKHYQLSESLPQYAIKIIEQAAEHLHMTQPFSNDIKKIQSCKNTTHPHIRN
jgi:ArsR family transcriptional regulator